MIYILVLILNASGAAFTNVAVYHDKAQCIEAGKDAISTGEKENETPFNMTFTCVPAIPGQSLGY